MAINNNANNPPSRWLITLIVMIALLLYFNALQDSYQRPVSIPYSEFKTLLAKGKVKEVTLRDRQLAGELIDPQPLGAAGKSADHFMTYIPEVGDEALLPALEERGITINVQPVSESDGWILMLAITVPWLLLLAFYYWAFRRASKSLEGGLGGRPDFKQLLKPPSKQVKIPETTFADVAGQTNAKREVSELVEYLRDPARFTRLGAEVPHGVLLVGPPGTGKTLLARALAGEAGVPFFSISASEFIEVFVGVGAARVRNLFDDAKKQPPSIIFIDELDSIGRTRGTGLGGGHDEREQTLNQILAEMDGFAGHEAVIVLAATNRPDILDPALLRPGRFDRHVTLDLPDRNDRMAILRLHSRKVPLAPDIDLDSLAGGTPGFSGADLKNLVNEAAILAARDNAQKVGMQHFEAARDKVLLGNERSLAITTEEHHRLAVHEAGHTVAAYYLPNADPLYKVTIIPRGHALGGTQQLPAEERHTLAEPYLRDRLAVILSGRTAEKLLLGSVSSGADDDIRQATHLARAMVARWGMSETIGPVDLRESDEHPFLGREIAQPRHFSERSAQAVDEAIQKLLQEATQNATAVINEHRSGLDRLIALLEKEETLHQQEITDCLEENDAACHG